MEKTKSENLYSKLNDLCSEHDHKENSQDKYSEQNQLISEVFNELYVQSEIDTFFWQFCNFKTFENNYEQRRIDYTNKFIDATNEDFIQSEILFLSENYQQDSFNPETGELEHKGYIYKYYFGTIELNNFLFTDEYQKIDFSQKRKFEFLESELGQLEYQPPENLPIPNPEILLDYSNNQRTERIVFLHELGILDFLREKMNKELHYFAPNKLAEIVSTFTDIQQGTAQPMLHPIFEKNVKQKNNPLTVNNLKKVRNKLKDIGFNNSKTT